MKFMFLINIICALMFLLQFYTMMYNYFNPSHTSSSTHIRNLGDIEFPVLFKLCVKPGFDEERLLEHGYESEFHYFVGQSRFNKTNFGFNGHFENETMLESTVLMKRLAKMENISHIAKDFYIRAMDNSKISIKLEHLKFRWVKKKGLIYSTIHISVPSIQIYA